MSSSAKLETSKESSWDWISLKEHLVGSALSNITYEKMLKTHKDTSMAPGDKSYHDQLTTALSPEPEGYAYSHKKQKAIPFPVEVLWTCLVFLPLIFATVLFFMFKGWTIELSGRIGTLASLKVGNLAEVKLAVK